MLRRLGLWFIVQLPASAAIGETVKIYRAGFDAMKGRFSGFVSPLEARTDGSAHRGIHARRRALDVAEDVAILPLLGAAPEIVLLAETEKVAVDFAAHSYFAMGALIGLDRLRALAGRDRQRGPLGPAGAAGASSMISTWRSGC